LNEPELHLVLTQIVALLSDAGRDDKASWLKDRLTLLRDPAHGNERRQSVLAELHSAVPGMGGLVDLRLEPRAAGLSPQRAREQLLPLADRLYELTS